MRIISNCIIFVLISLFFQSCVVLPKKYKTIDSRLSNLEAENKALKAQVDLMDNQLFVLEDVASGIQSSVETIPMIEKAKKEQAPQKTSAKTKIKEKEAMADFEQAFDIYKGGSYEEAIAEFSRFLRNYPNSSLVERAQYFLGECYFKQKEYLLAISEYYQVPMEFPNGKMAKKAILRAGEAYLLIGEKDLAKATFKQLTDIYPLTVEGYYGQQKLFELEENSK